MLIQIEKKDGRKIGELRTKEDTLLHIEAIKKAKTKKAKAQGKKASGVNDVENQFMDIPLDLNMYVIHASSLTM